jgi:2,5-diamino-6-(ribosylamino)-4(3H)-pyrimidinone 5'-phosphate reductase
MKEKEERILHVLELLSDESVKGRLIIVEGKKDVEALNNLNVKGKIICAKTGGKSLLDVISEIQKAGVREVILLLDFDRRGKEWTQRLTRHLERVGITPTTVYWHALFRLVGKDIRDIESLTSYMETLKSKINNS